MYTNMKVLIKDDNSIWNIEYINFLTKKISIEFNDEYISYYKDKYSVLNEPIDIIENEYNFDEVEIIL